jgi:tetratricopeptide (TPR) repeat protein
MLAYVTGPDRNEVFAASLIRLLESCDREEKRPALIQALREDPSPLVRSSAARVLGNDLVPEVIEALAAATADDYRIVRVRAAAGLAPVPARFLDEDTRDSVSRSTSELLESFTCRPDDYASSYNLGNFFAARRNYDAALRAYLMSARLRSDFVPTLVNASLVYNAQGLNRRAEESLRRALEIEPESVAAHLNLAMLLVEMDRMREAEKEFRTVLRIEPDNAQAAYNLGVLLAGKGETEEGLSWCREAHRIEPENPKYTYTLAFYLHGAGESGEAVRVLEKAIEAGAGMADLYGLLARIYEERGELDLAAEACRRAAGDRRFSAEERAAFERMADDFGRRSKKRRP